VFRESSYKLTFTKTGLYEYVCLNHPLTMRGTVDVVDAGAPVELPVSVATRGRAALSAAVEDAIGAIKRATEAAAARSITSATHEGAVHVVTAGIPTSSGQAMTFTNAGLNINAGDTVIFETEVADLHNVVFKGSRDAFPPAYDVYSDPEGRGLTVALSSESAAPVEPPIGGFDETTFLSSGTLGVVLGLPSPRFTWRLTFTQPGTYLYQCTIHVASGMAGVITVR
jgi:plastocyanin